METAKPRRTAGSVPICEWASGRGGSGVSACGRIGVFAVAFCVRAVQKPTVSGRNGEWARGRMGMRVPEGLPGFVPEGLNDRSQAIYCLVSVQKGNRPVGHGMIGSNRRATIRTINQPWATIIPSLRDGSVSTQFQAINCLATIIQSLRDANTPARPIARSRLAHSPFRLSAAPKTAPSTP
jgi:hypothetical protein